MIAAVITSFSTPYLTLGLSLARERERELRFPLKERFLIGAEVGKGTPLIGVRLNGDVQKSHYWYTPPSQADIEHTRQASMLSMLIGNLAPSDGALTQLSCPANRGCVETSQCRGGGSLM